MDNSKQAYLKQANLFLEFDQFLEFDNTFKYLKRALQANTLRNEYTYLKQALPWQNFESFRIGRDEGRNK